MDVKANLSNLVKTLRGDRTQKDFAARLGVTYGAIQSWEKGDVIPSSQNLAKIAEAAGYTMQQLHESLGLSNQNLLDDMPFIKVVERLNRMTAQELTLITHKATDKLLAIAEGSR